MDYFGVFLPVIRNALRFNTIGMARFRDLKPTLGFKSRGPQAASISRRTCRDSGFYLRIPTR
jgi:hypothetical protein